MEKKTRKRHNMVQVARTKNLALSMGNVEKLHFSQFAQLRRHSRVLYIPLDALTVRLLKIKKGDIVKYSLNELRRAPPEDEEEQGDEGEL